MTIIYVSPVQTKEVLQATTFTALFPGVWCHCQLPKNAFCHQHLRYMAIKKSLLL